MLPLMMMESTSVREMEVMSSPLLCRWMCMVSTKVRYINNNHYSVNGQLYHAVLIIEDYDYII